MNLNLAFHTLGFLKWPLGARWSQNCMDQWVHALIFFFLATSWPIIEIHRHSYCKNNFEKSNYDVRIVVELPLSSPISSFQPFPNIPSLLTSRGKFSSHIWFLNHSTNMVGQERPPLGIFFSSFWRSRIQHVLLA